MLQEKGLKSTGEYNRSSKYKKIKNVGRKYTKI